MKRLILIISFFTVFTIHAQDINSEASTIVPGAHMTASYLPLLKGKNVAMVVNQTSTIDQTHIVDSLLTLNVKIKQVFAPEHGFRGDADAGETVKSGTDVRTGLPIISLYGNNKKPQAEQLKGIDIIIFDIQDVGVRFYTYISTMHYVMEACAENNIPLIILDRPNPNGMYIGGPVLDLKFKSFVGMHPIPILHGMTVGELAGMINEEGWLANKVKCDFEVIKVGNYDHYKTYSLPVKPSPNLPNDLSILAYPSLCLFEGTVISVGRGTRQPFQQIGHPSFKDMSHCFTPQSITGMAKHPKYENELCCGVNLQKVNYAGGFTLQYLIDMYTRYDGEDFFNNYFDKLAGTDALREQIKSGLPEKEIMGTWQKELDAFKDCRKKYLLYKDFY